jgi:hypothetical protein
MGTMLFNYKNGEHRTFAGVYFIPKLTANIISVGQLDEAGFQMTIEGGVMRIRDVEHRLLTKVLRSQNHLYLLNVELARPVCLVARGAEDVWLWHARFRHLNIPVLHKLVQNGMVHGLPEVEHTDQVCSGCLAGKHRQTPFPHQANFRAKEVLGLVHSDLCGPILLATLTGNRYVLLLGDDYSRYMWLHTLRSKDQVAEAIKKF